ncbi:MAG: hypothetical protein R2758_00725 [Bacteroidales bacterium]
MNQSEQPLEDIRVIRKLMEESSRFLSLEKRFIRHNSRGCRPGWCLDCSPE